MLPYILLRPLAGSCCRTKHVYAHGRVTQTLGRFTAGFEMRLETRGIDYGQYTRAPAAVADSGRTADDKLLPPLYLGKLGARRD